MGEEAVSEPTGSGFKASEPPTTRQLREQTVARMGGVLHDPSGLPQYHGLNALMDMFGGAKFTVLGFPCNQFGLQSPEEDYETLDVLRCVRPGGGFLPKFPLFSRIKVNGQNENPLYTYMKDSLPSTNPVIGDIKKLFWSPIRDNDVRWNFEKFLIAPDGVPYKRYDPHCPFEEVERDIAAVV
ncbi:glutathione peroxidase 9 [Brachyhypopomus gauderio]|uniref:glutathione peroxidase 9 n=1 Tax=Brachyhypopomus gauderio TaxID=698409 RepID=UPI004042273F